MHHRLYWRNARSYCALDGNETRLREWPADRSQCGLVTGDWCGAKCVPTAFLHFVIFALQSSVWMHHMKNIIMQLNRTYSFLGPYVITHATAVRRPENSYATSERVCSYTSHNHIPNEIDFCLVVFRALPPHRQPDLMRSSILDWDGENNRCGNT